MYLLSGLHGHGESFASPVSGDPTECKHCTQSLLPSASSAPCPMRVMIRMLTATYALSVSCTPICAIGEPSGPIEKGTTYIVRPRMAPVYSAVISLRISSGSRQLLFGPASILLAEQINVRSSTRATSPGSECAQKEFGRLASSSFVNVPDLTSALQSMSYSL